MQGCPEGSRAYKKYRWWSCLGGGANPGLPFMDLLTAPKCLAVSAKREVSHSAEKAGSVGKQRHEGKQNVRGVTGDRGPETASQAHQTLAGPRGLGALPRPGTQHQVGLETSVPECTEDQTQTAPLGTDYRELLHTPACL